MKCQKYNGLVPEQEENAGLFEDARERRWMPGECDGLIVPVW